MKYKLVKGKYVFEKGGAYWALTEEQVRIMLLLCKEIIYNVKTS